MSQVTITLSREEMQRIADALNLQAVKYGNESSTIGVDCLHPDFFHTEWNKTGLLWLKVYNALNPEQ